MEGTATEHSERVSEPMRRYRPAADRTRLSTASDARRLRATLPKIIIAEGAATIARRPLPRRLSLVPRAQARMLQLRLHDAPADCSHGSNEFRCFDRFSNVGDIASQ